MRTYVKENYPEYKFSVTSKYFSGGSEINIKLKDTPIELTNFETMKAYIEKHSGNFNQIWDEDSHAYTSYYELDEEGKNNFIEEQLRVMPGHSISRHNLDEQLEWMTPEAKKVMKDVVLQLESYNFDHSDSQSDYFHVNFWSNYGIDAAAIEKSLQLNKEKPEYIQTQKDFNELVWNYGASGTKIFDEYQLSNEQKEIISSIIFFSLINSYFFNFSKTFCISSKKI